MSSFLKMKNSRAAEIAKIAAQVEKTLGGGQEDANADKFWNLTVGKDGNGSAIIRFLPAPDGEEMPFIRYWDHGFKGPSGNWYIEKSLNSIGKDDPVAEMNRKLWQQGEDSEGRKIVSGEGKERPGSKRRLHYVANIYVVKDPGNADNEGKVFLFKFGAKIFDKLNAVMHPEFDTIKQLNPFDLWEGANFFLRAAQVKGFRNYDQSAFDTAGPLFKDDKELERIWNLEHPLQPFLDESQYKSYDELKAKLVRVMEGLPEASGSTAAQVATTRKTAAAPKGKTKQEVPFEVEPSEDEDDPDNFFAKLAAEAD